MNTDTPAPHTLLHCDFPLVVKTPGAHSKTHYRLVHEIGVAVSCQEITAAVAEITTSRSSEHHFDDSAERVRAYRLAACWNACAGLADPAAELARLRAENERLRTALNSVPALGREHEFLNDWWDTIALPALEEPETQDC